MFSQVFLIHGGLKLQQMPRPAVRTVLRVSLKGKILNLKMYLDILNIFVSGNPEIWKAETDSIIK